MSGQTVHWCVPQIPQTIVFIRPSYAPPELFLKTAEAMPPEYVVKHVETNDRTSDEQIQNFFVETDGLHLVAHGAAAAMAYRFAAQNSERTKSLCLLDGFAQTDDGLTFKLESILAAINVSATLGAKVAAPWFFGSTPPKNAVDDLTKHFANSEAEKSLEAALGLGDARKWLRGVQCPTLIALGSDDVFTPMRYGHEMVEWIKPGLGVLITLTGAGHLSALERSDEFSRILSGFIVRHEEFFAAENEDDFADENESRE